MRCCGDVRCSKSRKPISAERPWCDTPLSILVLAILNFILLLAAISLLPGFGTSIYNVQTIAKDFSSTLQNAAQVMTSTTLPYTFTKFDGQKVTVTSLLNSINTGSAYASALILAVNSMNFIDVAEPVTLRYVALLFPSLSVELTASETAMNTAVTYINNAVAPIGKAGAVLSAGVNRIPFDLIKAYISQGGVIILGIFIGFMLIQSVMVCRNRFACCMFKGLVVVSVTLTSLIFILAAFFYMIGMFGADICYSPYTVINTLVGIGTADIAIASLSYYMTCIATSSTAGTFLETLNNSRSSLTLATTHHTAAYTRTAAITTAYPQIVNYFQAGSTFGVESTAIKESLVNGTKTLNLLMEEILSCDAVGNLLIDPIITNLCGGITLSIGISRILITLGFFLMIQLMIGVSICAHHPGDEHAWHIDIDAKPMLSIRSVVDLPTPSSSLAMASTGAPKGLTLYPARSLPLSMV